MNADRQPGSGKVVLTEAEVRRVAPLARIQLSDAEMKAMQAQLGAVLEHVRVLQELDLSHTTPMAHPSDTTNKLGTEAVESSLAVDIVTRLAPECAESFIVVPKVIGDDPGHS